MAPSVPNFKTLLHTYKGAIFALHKWVDWSNYNFLIDLAFSLTANRFLRCNYIVILPNTL